MENSRQYKSFEEAREFVRGLGLKAYSDWKSYSQSGEKPKDIPSNPTRDYKDQGWVSWSDWLGTAYMPFEKAKQSVENLNLQSQND